MKRYKVTFTVDDPEYVSTEGSSTEQMIAEEITEAVEMHQGFSMGNAADKFINVTVEEVHEP